MSTPSFRHSSPGRNGHKLAQLCAQVEEAVSYAFATGNDPLLNDLRVVAVRPVRGAALLEVEVATQETEGLDPDQLLAKLERAKGYLRSEIANGIHRKRCPDLCFSIAPGVGPTAR